MPRTLNILLIKGGQARLQHFDVRLRGESLWPPRAEEIARRLRAFKGAADAPELVAIVAGEKSDQSVQRLIDQLRQFDVAGVVLFLPWAEGPCPPAEEQLHRIVAAAVEQGLLNTMTDLRNTAALEMTVNRRIGRKEPFTFLHIDIDSFKAYNDTYGIDSGDEVIEMVGELLKRAAQRRRLTGHLLAHIGGDDFAAVLSGEDEEACLDLSDCLFEEFKEARRRFYSTSDLAAGHVLAMPRDRTVAEPTEHALMTLSVAAVRQQYSEVPTYTTLTAFATDTKKEAKLKLRAPEVQRWLAEMRAAGRDTSRAEEDGIRGAHFLIDDIGNSVVIEQRKWAPAKPRPR